MSPADRAAGPPLDELDNEWLAWGHQDSWELRARATSGHPPFSLLMYYALGLALSTEIPYLPTPTIYLIALACYDTACGDDLTDVELTPLAPAVKRLVDDQSARAIAVQHPGHSRLPGGRLREQAHRELLAAVQPGLYPGWTSWRENAADVLLNHLLVACAVPGREPVLRDQLSYVQATGVRRGWYDNPQLPALLDPDERL